MNKKFQTYFHSTQWFVGIFLSFFMVFYSPVVMAQREGYPQGGPRPGGPAGGQGMQHGGPAHRGEGMRGPMGGEHRPGMQGDRGQGQGERPGLHNRMDRNNDGKIEPREARFAEANARHDFDNNPPGAAGGPGTNWENPAGPAGGPGASPNSPGFQNFDSNPPGPVGGPGSDWANPPGAAGGPGASPNQPGNGGMTQGMERRQAMKQFLENHPEARKQFMENHPGIAKEMYEHRHQGDRDNNPPGAAGGPGTNWKNPAGPAGGPGASPDRHPFRRDFDNNPPGAAGGPGTNWENPAGPAGGPGASPNRNTPEWMKNRADRNNDGHVGPAERGMAEHRYEMAQNGGGPGHRMGDGSGNSGHHPMGMGNHEGGSGMGKGPQGGHGPMGGARGPHGGGHPGGGGHRR